MRKLYFDLVLRRMWNMVKICLITYTQYSFIKNIEYDLGLVKMYDYMPPKNKIGYLLKTTILTFFINIDIITYQLKIIAVNDEK